MTWPFGDARRSGAELVDRYFRGALGARGEARMWRSLGEDPALRARYARRLAAERALGRAMGRTDDAPARIELDRGWGRLSAALDVTEGRRAGWAARVAEVFGAERRHAAAALALAGALGAATAIVVMRGEGPGVLPGAGGASGAGPEVTMRGLGGDTPAAAGGALAGVRASAACVGADGAARDVLAERSCGARDHVEVRVEHRGADTLRAAAVATDARGARVVLSPPGGWVVAPGAHVFAAPAQAFEPGMLAVHVVLSAHAIDAALLETTAAGDHLPPDYRDFWTRLRAGGPGEPGGPGGEREGGPR